MSEISGNHDEKLAGGSYKTAAENLEKKKNAYVPTPNEIARRAYFNHLKHDAVPCSSDENWHAAEAELIKEYNRKT